jgi:galactoside O-acetyltransferase
VSNPFDTGYYGSLELRAFPFARVGENCLVARNCTIVGLQNITLGDNVRIDSYTALIAAAGSLRIGSHVHIGIGCVVGARGGVELEDFSSLSHGVRILSAIDDFSGRHMTNSTLPDAVLKVTAAPVKIGRYAPIGSGTIILPGVDVGEGAAVAAQALVNHSLEPWRIYAGNPVREVGPRSRDLLALVSRVGGAD